MCIVGIFFSFICFGLNLIHSARSIFSTLWIIFRNSMFHKTYAHQEPNVVVSLHFQKSYFHPIFFFFTLKVDNFHKSVRFSIEMRIQSEFIQMKI